MYRILEEAGETRERRDQLTHPAYQKPELLATAPNQLWSWDITKLKGPRKWSYFYLYVMLDVFKMIETVAPTDATHRIETLASMFWMFSRVKKFCCVSEKKTNRPISSASTTAPTIATRIRIDVTSKGNAYSVNSRRPIAHLVGEHSDAGTALRPLSAAIS